MRYFHKIPQYSTGTYIEITAPMGVVTRIDVLDESNITFTVTYNGDTEFSADFKASKGSAIDVFLSETEAFGVVRVDGVPAAFPIGDGGTLSDSGGHVVVSSDMDALSLGQTALDVYYDSYAGGYPVDAGKTMLAAAEGVIGSRPIKLVTLHDDGNIYSTVYVRRLEYDTITKRNPYRVTTRFARQYDKALVYGVEIDTVSPDAGPVQSGVEIISIAEPTEFFVMRRYAEAAVAQKSGVQYAVSFPADLRIQAGDDIHIISDERGIDSIITVTSVAHTKYETRITGLQTLAPYQIGSPPPTT